jgi:hypothetical protein
MKSPTRAVGVPEALILIGSCIFIFILWLSAYFEADIRWLHFFQAWMYLATIVLALRRNRWAISLDSPQRASGTTPISLSLRSSVTASLGSTHGLPPAS